MPHLGVGGAERIVSLLIENISKSTFNPILVVNKRHGKNFNCIGGSIPVIELNSRKVFFTICKIYKLIKQHKPDILFAGNISFAIILGFFKRITRSNIRIVVRHACVINKDKNNTIAVSILFFLAKYAYRNYDAIIAQTSYMKMNIINTFGINKDKIFIINNPVDGKEIKRLTSAGSVSYDRNYHNLVFVGRLSKEKGVDILLEIMCFLDNSVHLHIIGDGPEADALSLLSTKKKLQSRVFFHGSKANPYPWIAQADVMVLASREDSSPNVVLEAMCCKTPIIAFDCKGGIRELLPDPEWLVPNDDIDSYVAKLSALLVSKRTSIDYSTYVSKRFSLADIILQYENVFLRAQQN